MIPITFPDDYTVKMLKQIWSEQEQALAKCYDFSFHNSSEGMFIVCNLKKTDKNALINFISLSFRVIMESALRQAERDSLVGQINAMYDNMDGLRADFLKENLPYYDKFYKHQKDSTSLSLGRRCNLLSLEQGLGKTITAASISRALKLRRTLVVCIPVAKWNWLEDLTVTFGFNSMYFSLLDSRKSKTVKSFSPYHERFCITHYEALPKYMDYLLSSPIDHIIIDECQSIKNHLTKKFRYIEKIVKANPGIRISLLSGTPIKNRVNDLFAYFKLCEHPLGKNYTKFIRDYAATGQGRQLNKVVGARNIDQLTVNMANFMIRKTKEECLDLPERNYIKVTMDLDDYKEEYDQVIKDLIEKKDKSPLSSSITSLNRILAMSKVQGAIELVDTLLEQGKKIIVFTSYKDPINMMEAHYGDQCVKVDGTVQHSERFERVKRFRDDDSCRLFLGNIVAAGTSLNLTVASEVIFLNYPFTPTEISQCVDRAHRIGQEKKVNIYFLNCKDTIDDALYGLVANKQNEVNQIIDGGKGLDYDSDIPGILYKMITETNKKVEI